MGLFVGEGGIGGMGGVKGGYMGRWWRFVFE